MTDRLLVGTRKGFFVLWTSYGNWEVGSAHFLGESVNYILHDHRDGGLYAAIDLGHFGPKLRRSMDEGLTWDEIAAPAFPPGEGEDAPSVSLIWTLEPGGPDQPRRLWAGTIPGGLFRSDDCGESWTLNEPLWNVPERARWFGGGFDKPGIHSIMVDPRDSTCITVAVSCGGVWRSEDDGQSWELRTNGLIAPYMPPDLAEDGATQDPHCVVQCPAVPEAYWMQHHGGIFRSTDDLASWQAIEKMGPSTFGFAVAVHPDDPDMAWFVPGVKDEFRYPVDGKLVVTRTTDGGETAEVLSEGLPEATAYDVIYRHALDIDLTGEWLAMGSTTGGLWTTMDQGDTWQMLPDRLPPIYAVRFTEF